mgnify:CR=1 FL=1
MVEEGIRSGERCPSAEEIQGFVERRLTDAVHERIVRHVDRCSECRQWLAHLTSLASHGVEATEQRGGLPGRASQLGRYALGEELGRGAMGVVHAARDPQLGREVAIKLIDDAGGDVHARVLREARAMARVHHPNVVGVLDFGRDEDRFFVVMELVRGETLRQWQATARPWREVVDAYVQAGRGLSAAHQCGVVHRDFKPANVLVGEDGAVRVTDFGLARGPGCQVEVTAASEPAAQEVTHTTTGALVGTMAYMAPEQLEGEGATALADQFALCVALWEGLSGRRPFEGTTPEELLEFMRRGAPASMAPGVPRRVTAALRRGLALDPRRRHRSVDDLIAVLADATKPRRRRAVAVAGVGLSIAVAASVFAFSHLRSTSALERADERNETGSVVTQDSATEKELRDRLAWAREAVREDGLGEVVDACERLKTDAQAYGDAALATEVEVVCSNVHLAKGEIQAAGEALEAAYFRARAAGADAVALEASARRLLVALFEEGDLENAERWLAHAEAELEKTDSPRDAALVARAAASLWASRGDDDLAFDAAERGAEAARAGGLDRLEILLLEERANLLRSQLRHDEALAAYESLIGHIEVWDGDPLDVLSVRIGYGRTLVDAGFYEEGLAQFERIMGMLSTSRAHGEIMWTAEVADLRGDALRHLGRLTEARAAEEQCVRMLADVGVFIHIALSCQTEIFAIDALLGRCETIALELDRHVDTMSHRLGPDDPITATARVWNAYCRLATGDVEYARSELQMVVEARADQPKDPSLRLARALAEAEHWGIPVESVLQ